MLLPSGIQSFVYYVQIITLVYTTSLNLRTYLYHTVIGDKYQTQYYTRICFQLCLKTSVDQWTRKHYRPLEPPINRMTAEVGG